MPCIDRADLPPLLKTLRIQINESWRDQRAVLAGKLTPDLILHIQANDP